MMQQTVLRQIDELNRMPMGQLRKRWTDLFGPDPGPGALGRQYLIRRLAYRVQELAYGGLSRDTKRTLSAIANGTPAQAAAKRRPRKKVNLLPGARLLRDWHGERYEVVVQEKGFLYHGKHYKSLSAVARALTGAAWNGYRFFGLVKPNSVKREDA